MIISNCIEEDDEMIWNETLTLTLSLLQDQWMNMNESNTDDDQRDCFSICKTEPRFLTRFVCEGI